MEITVEKINDVAVISLKGKLSVTTQADLEKEFQKCLQENTVKAVVNCAYLEYISSAGLRVLLASAKQFKKVHGTIALASLSANVKQVFEISGFTSIFPIHASCDEAVQSLK